MTGTIAVSIKRLEHAADFALPRYETEHAAGVDLMACVSVALELPAGDRALISTGFAIALPEGYEAQVRPRSGLALKQGVTVLNAPGTIDADYRGEIGVILINHGDKPFVITRGLRIAQLVVAPVVQAVWRECDDLSATARGAGGFGSTGTGTLP